MHVTLASFIRNEGRDLVHWLAWHAALGVTDFLIFDDHSNDGTEQILEAASRSLGIGVFRLNLPASDPFLRQKEAFTRALRTLKGKSDWILFLDGDEYLWLPDHARIQTFLTRFDDSVGAVAVPWRYHHSRELLDAQSPPFEAYPRHLSAQEPINRHVKSLVRPQAWSGHWINPHYYSLKEPYRYALADNAVPQWSGQLGILENDPDWRDAACLHFQAPTLERFVERARLRHGISPDIESWRDLNPSQTDRRPTYAKKECGKIADRIIRSGAEIALDRLRAILKTDAEPTSALKPAFKISELRPLEGDYVEIHNGVPHRCKNPQNGARLIGLEQGDDIWLFGLSADRKPLDIRIDDDSRINGILKYEKTVRAEGEIVLRKHGASTDPRRYLCGARGESLRAVGAHADHGIAFALTPLPRESVKRAYDNSAEFRALLDDWNNPIANLNALPDIANERILKRLSIWERGLSLWERRMLRAAFGPFERFLF